MDDPNQDFVPQERSHHSASYEAARVQMLLSQKARLTVEEYKVPYLIQFLKLCAFLELMFFQKKHSEEVEELRSEGSQMVYSFYHSYYLSVFINLTY